VLGLCKETVNNIGPPTPFRLLCLAALLFGGAGCRDGEPVVADKIEIVSGNNQAGLPGTFLEEPLVVRVVGLPAVDILGRGRSPPPAAGVQVTFELEDRRSSRAADGQGGAGESAPASAKSATLEKQVVEGLYAGPRFFDTQPADPEKAEGKPVGASTLTVTTDASGLARVYVRLGARNGDWEISADIPKPKRKRHFRVITGIEKDAGLTESVVGAEVPLRIRLMALRPDSPGGDSKSSGKRGAGVEGYELDPLKGRTVLFELIGAADAGGDLKDRRNQTDAEGWRETSFKLGDKPGVYHVLAEVEAFPGDEPIRAITFSFVAMDWVLVGVLLATGTLVFVIGVRLLGSGFLLLTSSQAHLPTGPWAQSRVRGYLGGMVAGAIFESSSLVTSHLASFANGGLLPAAGAVGMILGANLGGTALPQILSLGIGGLAAPFLLVGTILFLLPRRTGMNAWAWACLGAGLILTGWSLLDHAAELTSLSREFKTDVLFGEANPSEPFGRYVSRFLAYFSLAAATAFFLGTSNLLVVVAMLIVAHGIVGPTTAIPMVLGANVGSAAMVFARSIRKRREARRIALTNLVFQGLGCLAALSLSLVTFDGHSLFSLIIETISPHRVLGGPAENPAHQVANAHTLFNLLAGLPFLFFPRALMAMVDRMIPPGAQTQDDIKPYLLDRHLIPVPALALRQAAQEVIYMTQVCRKTVAEAYDSFRYADLDLSEQVVRREEVLSGLHRDVVNYLVEVCENQLSRRDAVQMEVLVTAVNNLARIGQLGERLRELTARKIEEGSMPIEEMDRDLNEVYDLVMAQFANILVLLEERDPKTEENAVKMVERLAKFSSRIESQWRQRLEAAEGPQAPVAIYVQTIIYQEAFRILFDIASHLAHIAQQMRILSPDRV